jgi:hypothetical protein
MGASSSLVNYTLVVSRGVYAGLMSKGARIVTMVVTMMFFLIGSVALTECNLVSCTSQVSSLSVPLADIGPSYHELQGSTPRHELGATSLFP